MASGPDLRIGDADREAAAAALREHYAQGRLTLEEFNQRIDAAFAATRQSQLSALSRDLPVAAARPVPVPRASRGHRERSGPGHGPGYRSRLAMIPVLMAALLTWLLIFGLHVGLFPWPGTLALFLLIFGLLRGLMRRVWRAGGPGGPRPRGPRPRGPRPGGPRPGRGGRGRW